MNLSEPVVHVVDDDASFLVAMSRLLRAKGFAVRTFHSAADFLTREETDGPGCVVADLHMPVLNGLDLQRALARAPNPLPVVFLTGNADTVSTVRAMRNGAEDFLEKRAPGKTLVDAVERALARDTVDRAARERQQAAQARFARLTTREREVLAHVLRGRLNKQICSDLDVSERTVKLHRAGIMKKVRADSLPALTLAAQEAGFTAGADFTKGQ